MTTWEYTTARFTITDRWRSKHQLEEWTKLEQTLSAYGAEGWELVGWGPIVLVGGITGNAKDQIIVAVFKRQRPPG